TRLFEIVCALANHSGRHGGCRHHRPHRGEIMRTVSSLTTTRRAALGGAVAVALMLTSACGSDPDEAAPEATETQPAADSSTSESDNHGGGDDEIEQTVYALVEATSPSTLTLKSGSATDVVGLLGMADIE